MNRGWVLYKNRESLDEGIPIGPEFGLSGSISVVEKLAGGMAFTEGPVWVSDDNDFWTQVSSSAPYLYEEPLRRFRIAIPPVTNRYVKIVNTATPLAAGSGLRWPATSSLPPTKRPSACRRSTWGCGR